MTLNIIQTITNVLDESRKVLRTSTIEAYVLYPDTGKALQNTITGKIYTNSVTLGSKAQVKEYIEINV